MMIILGAVDRSTRGLVAAPTCSILQGLTLRLAIACVSDAAIVLPRTSPPLIVCRPAII